MTLKCVLKKNLFSCVHTQKNFFFASRQQQGVRSRLAYPENASFLLFLIYRDHTECTTKSIHVDKKTLFRYVSDLSRSHRAQGKEHTQTEKSSNPEKKNKTKILSL
jgi:hypothetical protein